MVNVNWQFQASVQGGPALAVNTPALSVAAYDVVEAAVENGTPATLPVPSGEILMLLLTSDHYDGDATKLSFDTGKAFDGPLLMIGSGAVSLLGTPPALVITNNLPTTVNVQMTVARNLS